MNDSIDANELLKILHQWAHSIELEIPSMKFIEVGRRNNGNFGMAFFYRCTHGNSRCLFVEIEDVDLYDYFRLTSKKEKNSADEKIISKTIEYVNEFYNQHSEQQCYSEIKEEKIPRGFFDL